MCSCCCCWLLLFLWVVSVFLRELPDWMTLALGRQSNWVCWGETGISRSAGPIFDYSVLTSAGLGPAGLSAINCTFSGLECMCRAYTYGHMLKSKKIPRPIGTVWLLHRPQISLLSSAFCVPAFRGWGVYNFCCGSTPLQCFPNWSSSNTFLLGTKPKYIF